MSYLLYMYMYVCFCCYSCQRTSSEIIGLHVHLHVVWFWLFAFVGLMVFQTIDHCVDWKKIHESPNTRNEYLSHIVHRKDAILVAPISQHSCGEDVNMHPRLEVYYSRHDLIIASPLRQSIRKSYSNFHGRVGKTNKTFKVQCFSHKHGGGVKYGARGILSPQYVTTEVGYPSRAV